MTTTEKELIYHNAEDDPSVSLTDLFFALESPLLRYVLKIVHDDESAQDIVQEAFYRLHQRWGHVMQPRPWLYRTVRNLAIDQYHRHKKVVHLDIPDNPDFMENTMSSQVNENNPQLLPDEALEALERVGLCRCFLEAMREPDQSVVRLKFEENLSYREIADNTGLSISNVGYILHHALKSLAQEFQQAGLLE